MSLLQLPQEQPWSDAEDNQLQLLVELFGCDSWEKIAKIMNQRSEWEISNRYNTYIIPLRNYEPFSRKDDKKLVQLQFELGNNWDEIAS